VELLRREQDRFMATHPPRSVELHEREADVDRHAAAFAEAVEDLFGGD
jgi:hypothetical protein